MNLAMVSIKIPVIFLRTQSLAILESWRWIMFTKCSSLSRRASTALRLVSVDSLYSSRAALMSPVVVCNVFSRAPLITSALCCPLNEQNLACTNQFCRGMQIIYSFQLKINIAKTNKGTFFLFESLIVVMYLPRD